MRYFHLNVFLVCVLIQIESRMSETFSSVVASCQANTKNRTNCVAFSGSSPKMDSSCYKKVTPDCTLILRITMAPNFQDLKNLKLDTILAINEKVNFVRFEFIAKASHENWKYDWSRGDDGKIDFKWLPNTFVFEYKFNVYADSSSLGLTIPLDSFKIDGFDKLDISYGSGSTQSVVKTVSIPISEFQHLGLRHIGCNEDPSIICLFGTQRKSNVNFECSDDAPTCDFLLTVKCDEHHNVYLYVRRSGTKTGGPQYLSIGFSRTHKMSPALVFDCISVETGVFQQNSYNHEYNNSLISKSIGLKMATEKKGNSFECLWKLKRSQLYETDKFNLQFSAEPYYILWAYGQYVTNKQYHSEYRAVTNSMHNVTNPNLITTKESETTARTNRSSPPKKGTPWIVIVVLIVLALAIVVTLIAIGARTVIARRTMTTVDMGALDASRAKTQTVYKHMETGKGKAKFKVAKVNKI